MTIKVSSIGLKGLEGYRVQVEVQISTRFRCLSLVGKSCFTLFHKKILR
ncbi:hypothetical protein ACFYKX_14140 [Cytobacillus sp. FJAT-54145]|uniref:Uncharacterized protein n=1 Tax=Cytobacillus spartinae TaxID=3299023 RepID=A0ABW6KFX6_9BACI